MAKSEFYNLDTDITLGGNNASDIYISSQKAVKTYVDGKVPSDISDLTDDTATYPIDQADSVTNQRSGGSAIKAWTGTRQQYDAIVTKDANTLYNITDDTDVTLSLLELLYPVGSIYIGTMSTCPLAVLGVGTWALKATDRVLQGSGTNNAGVAVEAGLPNITGEIAPATTHGLLNNNLTVYELGAFKQGSQNTTNGVAGSTGTGGGHSIGFDASRSSSIYGNSTTVQPPAYIVNIWERIS